MFYLQDIFCPHPVEDVLGFVGHPDDVVLHGVAEEASLVDQLHEGPTGVLLQRVLPLLGAQQHHQLHHRRAVSETDGLVTRNRTTNNCFLFHNQRSGDHYRE